MKTIDKIMDYVQLIIPVLAIACINYDVFLNTKPNTDHAMLYTITLIFDAVLLAVFIISFIQIRKVHKQKDT